MAGMNIFSQNANGAFSMIELTGTVERLDYLPQTLGELNIFDPVPVRTREVFVDRRDGGLRLIPTSPLGSAPESLAPDDRDAVSLRTVRLAKEFTLYAHEIDGIRQYGSTTELMQVQAEYLRRMGRIRNDMELTHEYHRLGALQGLLLDADGTSVIYDYFGHFGVAPPPVVSFNLANPNANLRTICHELKRSAVRSSRGALGTNTQFHALAGDTFYDMFTSHPNVEKTFLNWSAAADLRQNTAWQAFTFGGITWHNYRGTDDNSTVAIDTDEAKFFPVGAPDVFKKAMSPAEFGPFINTPGQNTYAINIIDRDRAAFTKGELYSYPLYICQKPEVLRTGRI